MRYPLLVLQADRTPRARPGGHSCTPAPSCLSMNMNTPWAHTHQTDLGGLDRREEHGAVVRWGREAGEKNDRTHQSSRQ